MKEQKTIIDMPIDEFCKKATILARQINSKLNLKSGHPYISVDFEYNGFMTSYRWPEQPVYKAYISFLAHDEDERTIGNGSVSFMDTSGYRVISNMERYLARLDEKFLQKVNALRADIRETYKKLEADRRKLNKLIEFEDKDNGLVEKDRSKEMVGFI